MVLSVVLTLVVLAAALCFGVACRMWRERAEHAEVEVHKLAETINKQSFEILSLRESLEKSIASCDAAAQIINRQTERMMLNK